MRFAAQGLGADLFGIDGLVFRGDAFGDGRGYGGSGKLEISF